MGELHDFGASVEIEVTIAATDPVWNAEGRLISENDDECEGFAFLRDLDPVSCCGSMTRAPSP